MLIFAGDDSLATNTTPLEVNYGSPPEIGYGSPPETNYGSPPETNYGAPIETTTESLSSYNQGKF